MFNCCRPTLFFWSIGNNPNVAVLAIKNVNSRYNKKNCCCCCCCCCCCSGLYFNIETCWPGTETSTVEKTWKLQEIAFRRPLVQGSCLAGPLEARWQMAVTRIWAAKTLGLHVCNEITTLWLEKIFLFFPQYDVQVWHVFLWNIDVYNSSR